MIVRESLNILSPKPDEEIPELGQIMKKFFYDWKDKFILGDFRDNMQSEYIEIEDWGDDIVFTVVLSGAHGEDYREEIKEWFEKNAPQYRINSLGIRGMAQTKKSQSNKYDIWINANS